MLLGSVVCCSLQKIVIRTTVRIGVHSQFPFEEGSQPHLTCVSAIYRMAFHVDNYSIETYKNLRYSNLFIHDDPDSRTVSSAGC